MTGSRLVWGAALAAVLAAGCTEEASDKDTYKMGALLTVSDKSLGTVGSAQREAVALAIKQINAAGGVLGKDLEMVAADDGNDPDQARNAAQKLVDSGAQAVIGAVGSGSTLAAAEVLSAKGVLQISASATSPKLTTFPDQDFLFRTVPLDSMQGKLLAQLAMKQCTAKAINPCTAAVLATLDKDGNSDAYGSGLASAFTEPFKALGGVVTYSGTFKQAQTSYRDVLETVYGDPAKEPHIILAVAYALEGSRLVRDFKSYFKDAHNSFWLFGDAAGTEDFVLQVGATPFDHEGTVPSASGPIYDLFAKAYQEAYGKAPDNGNYVAQAYDAVFAVALAAEQAGKWEGPAIRDQLRSVCEAGEGFTPEKYAEAVAAIRAGKDVDFDGTTNKLHFDGGGDIESSYDVWQVKDGKKVILQAQVTPE